MPGNLQDIPMSVIASWPQPNYVDPVTRSWMPAYAITWQVAAALLVGVRFWLRLTRRAGGLGLDDAFLLPALLFAVMFTVLACVATSSFGADRHTWDTPLDEFEYLALSAWLSEIAFLLTTSATKISVLLFYRRLTVGTYSKRWKWAIWAALVFTALYCFGFIFALGFNCRPVQAYWEAFNPSYTEDYTCTDTKILNPLSGALSVFSDLYAVVLPMAMMRHFEMDRRKKLALNLVFSLSLLVVGAGIARTYYFTRLGRVYDITWAAFDVLVWTQLEVQLAVVCACAPVLRVLVRAYMREPRARAFTTFDRSGAGSRAEDRASRPSNPIGIVAFTTQQQQQDGRDSQDWEGKGDKTLLRHSVKPSLETVVESVPSTARSERDGAPGEMVVDVEAYALAEWDRARRPLPTRDGEMKPSLAEPFSASSWYSPNNAWQERPAEGRDMG